MHNKDLPAYPITEEATDRIDEGIKIYTGLTKRERIAMAAMQGLLSNYVAHGMYTNHESYPNVANDAVKQVDALLAELEETSS